MSAAKADSILMVVWWLWLLPALLVVALPLEFVLAVCARGLESVRSSGIHPDGFALLGPTAVLSLLGWPPLFVLSALYAFLFSRRRKQGMQPSARLWVPIHGSVLLVLLVALIVLVQTSR